MVICPLHVEKNLTYSQVIFDCTEVIDQFALAFASISFDTLGVFDNIEDHFYLLESLSMLLKVKINVLIMNLFVTLSMHHLITTVIYQLTS